MTFLTLILFITITALNAKELTLNECLDMDSGNHVANKDVNDNATRTQSYCICIKNTCARKCCAFGFSYHNVLKACVESKDIFKPPVWTKYYSMVDYANVSEEFHFLTGKQNCSKGYRYRLGQTSKTFRLQENGKLYTAKNNMPPWTEYTPEHYCIDTFILEHESGEQYTKLDALICSQEDNKSDGYLWRIICMLISCVFILLTVAVYAWLPELKNLHGQVLMAYLLCLLVGFVFLSTMQLLLLIDNIKQSTCVVLTFFIYYFLLAAFFWLNIMCFDIWWTFSGNRGQPMNRRSNKARFKAYCAYSFGIPAALLILLATLEFSNLPWSPYLPNIRTQGCFLFGKSKLIYFYGPIVILCIANIIFFTLTAVRIASINKQTSVLKSKESATHDQQRNDRQRLLLYVKLFLVMGISWILEVISALYPEADEFWKYTDAYNILIGLTIFIIFVCKRKIFRLAKKRYKQVRGEPMSRTQTTSSNTTCSREEFQLNSTNEIKMNEIAKKN